MFDFNQWFEFFWRTYPNDLLHNTKGPKTGNWVSKLRRYVNCQARATEVIEALDWQIERSREMKEKGENKTMWHYPAVSVWCNQQRWSIEKPDKADSVHSLKYKASIYKLPEKKEVNHGAVKTGVDAMRAALRGNK